MESNSISSSGIATSSDSLIAEPHPKRMKNIRLMKMEFFNFSKPGVVVFYFPSTMIRRILVQ
jgi:hypothetical protein